MARVKAYVMRMEPTNETLARAAADGDAVSFSVLLERRYDPMFRLAFRLTGDQFEAEDLVQDICVALPAKIIGFDGRSKFSTWLYRVTVNAAHDRRRRQASHSRAAEGWGSWEIARRQADAETSDRTDWLIAAMGSLPETLRDTLALVLDNITHAQAAEVLGVSEGTISWRISEAKKLLKEYRKQEDQA